VSRPSDNVVTTEVPELRILPQALWDQAKKRQAELDARRRKDRDDEAQACSGTVRTRRPIYALSGLLRCGDCGGGMSRISNGRVGCSSRANKGKHVCENRWTVAYDKVEAEVLEAIQFDLMHGDKIAGLVEDFNRRARGDDPRRRARCEELEAALAGVEEEIAGLVAAIARMPTSTALDAALRDAEARKQQLERDLAQLAPPRALCEADIEVADYRRNVRKAFELLQRPEAAVEVNALLRTLITGVECIAPCYHEDWAWTFQVNGKLPLRDALEDAMMAYLDARESGLPTPPITLAKLVAGA
jgi:hypothetical protein